MASFIHYDRIIERLEMARAMGIVTSYFVGAADPACQHEAGITVWGNAGVGEDAIKDHLGRMLHGFVARDEIVVVLPFAAEPTAPDGAIATGSVPVAA